MNELKAVIKQKNVLSGTIKNSMQKICGRITAASGGQGDTRYITTEAAIYSRSSGTVPITFTTTGSKLADYTINGTYEGVGDSSINYFSGTLEQGGINSTSGRVYTSVSRLRSTDYVELEAGDYLISIEKSNTGQSFDFSVYVYLYGAGDAHTYVGTLTRLRVPFPFRFTVEENQVIKFARIILFRGMSCIISLYHNILQ